MLFLLNISVTAFDSLLYFDIGGMLLLLSIYIFQSLEDLVNSLIKALERQRSRGPCTREDYENVMKGLRYQLVAMAMSYMCRQSTPRIEIQVSRARGLVMYYFGQ